MWEKTRSILAYLHDHYRHNYDFFWVGGDDTFMVVENMKRYLAIVEDRYGVAASQTSLLYLAVTTSGARPFALPAEGPAKF
jgi:hypothetical protein